MKGERERKRGERNGNGRRIRSERIGEGSQFGGTIWGIGGSGEGMGRFLCRSSFFCRGILLNWINVFDTRNLGNPSGLFLPFSVVLL